MKKFIEKYYFLILPFIVTVFMLLQKTAFSQVDDRFMMEMANSFKTNSHSEHIMFINVIFGYGLKFLYNIFPQINWFAVMYILVLNIAFIPLYKITQKYNYKVIFAGILVCLQISVFVFLTFTFLSFICATSAILWALENVREINKKTFKHLFLSLFLLCLGFGMRAGNTFICVMLIFLPVYYFAITQKRNSVWVIISLIAITTISNYSMIGFQKEYKKAIPEETYFNQFQAYRAVISDDMQINYEDKKEMFDSLGITENDIYLYKNWKYGDKNVFSEENLKAVVNSKTFSDKYTLNILEFSFHPLVILVTLAYIILTVICMILFRHKRKEIFLFSIFVLGAIVYLHIRRRAPFRVVFPIIVLAITTLMYIIMQDIKNGFKFKLWHRKILYVSIILLITGLSGYNILNISKIEKTELEAQKVIAHINSDKTKTYITDETGESVFVPHILSLRLAENDFVRPCNIFGDWYIYSYFWYDRLENLNLSEYHDSAFKALLDENVRMVYKKNTDTLDRICLFLKEHYDIDSKYKIEDAIDGTSYYIYKFEKVN